jgi:hypothetical protein
MRRLVLLVALLGLSAIQFARASEPPRFAGGTQVVIVAPLPENAGLAAGKIMLPVGPDHLQYTLEIGPDIQAFDQMGQRLSATSLQRGWWIRASGTAADDPQTLRISNIQVLGPDVEAQQSAFYRRSFPAGYVMSVAGTREIFPRLDSVITVEPTILVGRVTAADGAARRVRVAAGPNEWTLSVADNAAIIGTKGDHASLQDLASGAWIRAEGWQTDDLHMRTVQLRLIGANEEEFRASRYNRPGFTSGYVTRVAADRLTVQPTRVKGTVTQVNRGLGFFVVRGDDGKEQTVYVEGTRFRVGDKPAAFDTLKVGDKVEVTGRLITSGRPAQ